MKKLILSILATGLMAYQAQAVLVTSGVGVLPSTTGGGAGDTLTVNYSVDLTGGVYTYDYTLNNPSTDTTSPDQFSVSFNAQFGFNVTGGNYSVINTGSSVTWFFNPVAPGMSTMTLDFTSPFGPGPANAGANDSNPPAPWSTSAAGGHQVVAPAPDGGSAVALLGIAMATIEGVRRMIRTRKA